MGFCTVLETCDRSLMDRIPFLVGQRVVIESAGYTELSEWIVRREGAFNVFVTHHGSRGLGADG